MIKEDFWPQEIAQMLRGWKQHQAVEPLDMRTEGDKQKSQGGSIPEETGISVHQKIALTRGTTETPSALPQGKLDCLVPW